MIVNQLLLIESAKLRILRALAPTHLTHHWYVSLFSIESGKLRVLCALVPYPSLILALRALQIIKYASAWLRASTQINRCLTRLSCVVLLQLKGKVCLVCSLQLTHSSSVSLLSFILPYKAFYVILFNTDFFHFTIAVLTS